ncbi:MAG: CCA tRNA nucleotidyltransferase [Thainema sp.]
MGGSVRDALLGRQADYLDLDFVLAQGAVQVAKQIANHYQAGFVLLDPEHQIARVVFEQATVDFAQQVGPSLYVDLHRRDFTVNAIAFSPHTRELLDPLQGCEDLQRRQIRMVAAENLKDDPLRLLRAYRQAAQLGFRIESETELYIRQFAPLLEQVAAERVQGELNYLLGKPEGTRELIRAWKNGLFQAWLPDMTETGLQRLKQLDQAAIAIVHACPEFEAHVSGWIRSSANVTTTRRSWLRLAKLSQLLPADADQAEQQLWCLKYSRAEIQSAIAVIRDLPWVMEQLAQPMNLRQQYDFFQAVGGIFPAIALLCVAYGVDLDRMLPLIQRFLQSDDPVAHPSPLITGRELMATLDIAPGPQIGQLLEAIQIARAEGKVRTAPEAKVWIQTYVANLDQPEALGSLDYSNSANGKMGHLKEMSEFARRKL